MNVAQTFNETSLPVVAVTLGDPAGIGPELVARLLARPEATSEANVVLVGDLWLWEQGQKTAGLQVEVEQLASLEAVRARRDVSKPAFIAVDSVRMEQVSVGVADAAGGASVLQVLDMCMDAVSKDQVDAICFAPLNKYAMKLGGLKFEDELHYFADRLGVTGFICEFNTLGTLWTSRISSHIPLRDAAGYIQKGRIEDATRLIYRAVQASGQANPRVAVAAFNPHGGDGGTCGREEIDIIVPAMDSLRAQGFPVLGPFPADTIFLKARDGEYDAVVTMYHDQGQIAIKLLGFSKGVSVQGGLPIPITTPAHGTAYDIAGKGKADVNATANALSLAARMGRAFRLGAVPANSNN